MNEMEQIHVQKVTVNIGIGEVGDDVQLAKKLIERLTGSDAVTTESTFEARGFGVRDGLNIGAKTTLRGEAAEEFLERMFDALEDDISISQFDETGNFSFGIPEYINVPGMDYDPDIGMMGFEIAVNLERPGYRVGRRKEDTRSVGDDHRVTPDEAAEFVQDRFGIEVRGA